MDLCKIAVSQYAILPTDLDGLLVSMFSGNDDDDRTLFAGLLSFWNRSFSGDLCELVVEPKPIGSAPFARSAVSQSARIARSATRSSLSAQRSSKFRSDLPRIRGTRRRSIDQQRNGDSSDVHSDPEQWIPTTGDRRPSQIDLGRLPHRTLTRRYSAQKRAQGRCGLFVRGIQSERADPLDDPTQFQIPVGSLIHRECSLAFLAVDAQEFDRDRTSRVVQNDGQFPG